MTCHSEATALLTREMALGGVDAPAPAPTDLHELLQRRRTIKKLRPGALPDAALQRVLSAVQQTPSAYNQPPWHLVVVRERRAALWDAIAAGFREQLRGDRLERYLARLDAVRPGAGAILVYEDRQSAATLQQAWGISTTQADAFVQQGLGMVQLTLWLALTAEGFATSLQHWEWLVEAHLAEFLNLPAERWALTALLPIGRAAEEPAASQRPTLQQIVSHEQFSGEHRNR